MDQRDNTNITNPVVAKQTSTSPPLTHQQGDKIGDTQYGYISAIDNLPATNVRGRFNVKKIALIALSVITLIIVATIVNQQFFDGGHNRMQIQLLESLDLPNNLSVSKDYDCHHFGPCNSPYEKIVLTFTTTPTPAQEASTIASITQNLKQQGYLQIKGSHCYTTDKDNSRVSTVCLLYSVPKPIKDCEKLVLTANSVLGSGKSLLLSCSF